MSLLGEAVLTSFLQVVFDKISSELIDFARGLKVDATLKKWKRTLGYIQNLLCDAEEKQMKQTNNTAITVWLNDLKGLAYDMEDVLDEFHTEARKQTLIRAKSQTSTSKVRMLISSWVDPSGLMFNGEIGKLIEKIKKITEDLDAIEKHGIGLGLQLREGVQGGSFGTEERPQTVSLLGESSVVYGRDHDRDAIIQLLLSDEAASDNKLSVIPIVGMGGVGKTTLAKYIYNDDRVAKHFDTRIWVCVSDLFDAKRITKAILEKITGRPSNFENLEPLQQTLNKELNGKKFFLVLDDIWNEDFTKWDALRGPFEGGARGSKFVVTTRNENVASIMQTVHPHRLKKLSSEHCWSLFAEDAFKNINLDARQNLEPIGRKIVERCKGLPLAAKTLASLLRSKQNINEWNRVLISEIWELSNEISGILPALRLSYHYLPAKFKRCFAYCSIFPKDFEFEKEKLVLLWMAEGLVDDKNKTIEEVGDEYFDGLLSRSFFEQSSRRHRSLFVMHDMLNDLAQYVSGEFCFRLDTNKQHKISEKARHSSYDCEQYTGFTKFNPFFEAKNLRTLLPLNLSHEECFLAKGVPHHLLTSLRCLRVLSFSHYRIAKLPDSISNLKLLRYLDLSQTPIKRLPESASRLYNLQTLILSQCYYLIELLDSIGNLKHMRYLDLSGTPIKRLPESTSTLYNLQTLLLLDCRSLIDWPTDIWKLINLHHLDIGGTCLKEMPIQMSRLKGLQTLTAFIVGKDSGSTIRELRELQHLRGTLSIQKLQNVGCAADALWADLKDKKYINELVLEWGSDTDDSEKERDILDKSQPHTNLKKLTIKYYGGTRFPNWLGNPSFCNMVVLHLSNCLYCWLLPSLGQLPSLKNLTISRMNEVREVGHAFYADGSSSNKSFQSLETLRFEGMEKWEEWLPFGDEGVDFPCLRELSIFNCPKLTGNLPNHLPCLLKLEISQCQQLVSSLPRASSMHELKLDGYIRSSFSNLTRQPDDGLTTCSSQMYLKELLHSLTSLKKLELVNCPSLLSFPEKGLPPTLEVLQINKCEALVSLPEGMMHTNACLQSLSISVCPSLVSFPRAGLPTTLKSLGLYNCKKLEFLLLPEEMMHPNKFLQTLSISGCDSLRSFPLGFFTKLVHLSIFYCRNLESLWIPDGPHDGLSSLHSLEIWNCPNLVSFPKGGLPSPNLTMFTVRSCKNLKSLPERMTNLTSLRQLYITDCPELVSIPEGGLPSNLEQLCIWDCDKLTPRVQWGLKTLSSLQCFSIKGGCKDVESFPEEWLLPYTLTSLYISELPNLKTLDKNGLQHLTSLAELKIENCPNLQSLPEEGLPASLFLLSIIECPLLKQWCQNEKGEVLPKIAHIPCIEIDEQQIS